MENRDDQWVEANNYNPAEGEERKKGTGRGHGLLMMLCCIIPIVLFGALPLLGFEYFSWRWMFFLLCPLMHIGMIFLMRKQH